MMASNSNFYTSFLNDLNLTEYNHRFSTQGYEYFTDIARISKQDLENLNIISQDHQGMILNAVNSLPIERWLAAFNLQCYQEKFVEEGIVTLKELKALKVTEDVLDKLEIMVPGHRKRFILSVQSLPMTKYEDTAGPFHPEAIAVGYWIKPKGDFFKHLEHDFLCVKGFFKSGSKDDARQSDVIEFLVDSASDVVTARKQIIDELELEYVKTVESCGIHMTALKPLYKGFLKVGKSRWIEVEVQPDEYESIGSTVMKNFLHYINGTFHQWLPLEVAAGVHT